MAFEYDVVPLLVLDDLDNVRGPGITLEFHEADVLVVEELLPGPTLAQLLDKHLVASGNVSSLVVSAGTGLELPLGHFVLLHKFNYRSVLIGSGGLVLLLVLHRFLRSQALDHIASTHQPSSHIATWHHLLQEPRVILLLDEVTLVQHLPHSQPSTPDVVGLTKELDPPTAQTEPFDDVVKLGRLA